MDRKVFVFLLSITLTEGDRKHEIYKAVADRLPILGDCLRFNSVLWSLCVPVTASTIEDTRKAMNIQVSLYFGDLEPEGIVTVNGSVEALESYSPSMPRVSVL